MVHSYILKKGASFILGNKTFVLEQDTQVFSFCDAVNDLEICDAMKHLYCQGSDKDIFTIKLESLKNKNTKLNGGI